jgi:hypothetical protein
MGLVPVRRLHRTRASGGRTHVASTLSCTAREASVRKRVAAPASSSVAVTPCPRAAHVQPRAAANGGPVGTSSYAVNARADAGADDVAAAVVGTAVRSPVSSALLRKRFLHAHLPRALFCQDARATPVSKCARTATPPRRRGRRRPCAEYGAAARPRPHCPMLAGPAPPPQDRRSAAAAASEHQTL